MLGPNDAVQWKWFSLTWALFHILYQDKTDTENHEYTQKVKKKKKIFVKTRHNYKFSVKLPFCFTSENRERVIWHETDLQK